MTTSLRHNQARILGALLAMAAVYLAKGWLFQWLREHGLFAVYVPRNLTYAEALRTDRALVNGLFVYELSNYLLCVWLITSLKQATGFLPIVVKFITYLLATLYVLGLAGSLLPALLPRFVLLG